jgi:acyl-CoA dehydrogenase
LQVAWDFTVDREYQEKLDWADGFVREYLEPLDDLYPKLVYHQLDDPLRSLVAKLKQEVRDHDLWAAHLGPELGGKGFGQLKLALLNEVIGRSRWGPIVFGCAAPDTGNAEILAAYGSAEQKARYLEPLLNGDVFSCYSMTEPQGGSDPKEFRCRAVRDGGEWVISGEKFFSSHLRMAEFLIVMAVTNPDVSPYKGMSMFLVPADTPGINVLHHLGMGSEDWYEGTHAHVRYEDVRVPAENLLGGEGQAFEVAQRRLGGGRIHHAMRSVARAKKMFEMTCERALSRHTQGSVLADKQAVQLSIADSWMKLEQFRLLVMYTAWLIDQSSTAQVRHYISACKVVAADVLADIATKAAHIHGALGVSNAMFFSDAGGTMSLVDGPSEVHKIAVARQVLKDYRPHPDGWPTELKPRRLVNARRRFEEIVQQHFPDPETQSAFGSFLQESTVPDHLYKDMQDYLDSILGANL